MKIQQTLLKRKYENSEIGVRKYEHEEKDGGDGVNYLYNVSTRKWKQPQGVYQ